MNYRCHNCQWTGNHETIDWKPYGPNADLWAAFCPECDSDDVGEVEEKDPDELRETLVDIARAGAGL